MCLSFFSALRRQNWRLGKIGLKWHAFLNMTWSNTGRNGYQMRLYHKLPSIVYSKYLHNRYIIFQQVHIKKGDFHW